MEGFDGLEGENWIFLKRFDLWCLKQQMAKNANVKAVDEKLLMAGWD